MPAAVHTNRSIDDISRFREGWKFAPLIPRSAIERLRAFFKFCIDRESMERNPADRLKLPSVDEEEVKPYAPVELEAVKKSTGRISDLGIYKTRVSGIGSGLSCSSSGGRGCGSATPLRGMELDFNFHPHCFRHALAGGLWLAGVPIAAILGNSPRIFERHSSPFVAQRQKAIEDAVKMVGR